MCPVNPEKIILYNRPARVIIKIILSIPLTSHSLRNIFNVLIVSCILAGFKNAFGGEIKGYTELLEESRKEATERMIKQAQVLGANAIVNIRYATSAITVGAAEVFAYGTAIIVEEQ